LLDSGFDDVAVWRTIWEANEHLLCRVYHQERLVSFQDQQGQWQQGKVEQARGQMRPLARVQTTLVAKRGKQPHAKKQPVEVEVAACPLRVSYWTGVRRKQPGERVTREVWLVDGSYFGDGPGAWCS